MTNKHIYITCACTGHVLRVSYDKEDQFFDIVFFEYGFQSASLLKKLKMIWKIITTGSIDVHDVIIDKPEAIKLINFLKNNTEI